MKLALCVCARACVCVRVCVCVFRVHVCIKHTCLRVRAWVHVSIKHVYLCARASMWVRVFVCAIRMCYVHYFRSSNTRSRFMILNDEVNILCESICHRFESVKALRSALYYNVGYFEASQHKKKWLVSSADLLAMYALFKGKKHIPLWCEIPMMMKMNGHRRKGRKKQG